MLRKAVCLLITIGLGTSLAAENLLVLKIGPTWPKELQWSKLATAGNATIMGGWIIDRKLSFGGGVDFLWNVNRETSPLGNNSFRIKKIQKSFMFPVSGFLSVDPVPDLRIHPCATVQIGLNTLYYSSKADSVQNSTTRPGPDQNGWYMGFFCKIAADAIFNLGEKSGLFAGVEYQWAKADKLNQKSNDILTQRNMGGFGLRAGFRVVY